MQRFSLKLPPSKPSALSSKPRVAFKMAALDPSWSAGEAGERSGSSRCNSLAADAVAGFSEALDVSAERSFSVESRPLGWYCSARGSGGACCTATAP
jgi:hypothetical protein